MVLPCAVVGDPAFPIPRNGGSTKGPHIPKKLPNGLIETIHSVPRSYFRWMKYPDIGLPISLQESFEAVGIDFSAKGSKAAIIPGRNLIKITLPPDQTNLVNKYLESG